MTSKTELAIADHTHDEDLRGVEFFDFERVESELKLGVATADLLHDEYGETRGGAEIIPATE